MHRSVVINNEKSIYVYVMVWIIRHLVHMFT